jgi:hypothetical protein
MALNNELTSLWVITDKSWNITNCIYDIEVFKKSIDWIINVSQEELEKIQSPSLRIDLILEEINKKFKDKIEKIHEKKIPA